MLGRLKKFSILFELLTVTMLRVHTVGGSRNAYKKFGEEPYSALRIFYFCVRPERDNESGF